MKVRWKAMRKAIHEVLGSSPTNHKVNGLVLVFFSLEDPKGPYPLVPNPLVPAGKLGLNLFLIQDYSHFLY